MYASITAAKPNLPESEIDVSIAKPRHIRSSVEDDVVGGCTT